MRNLEECRAEVFRRSEKRIKERRKRRNCMLACGIPLCVVLVVGAIRLPELLTPVDESLKTEKREVRNITGTDTVVALQEFMAGVTEATDKDGAAGEEKLPDDLPPLMYAASAEQKKYEFTFQTEDGEEFLFRLEGKTLFDVKNDTEIMLSNEQLETLKEILGLEE